VDSHCTNGIDTGFVALGYAKVAVLGVVQGITELMPISSTAHMRIVPALLGWPDPGSAFSAAMQLAALAAVISYFWRDVRDLVFGSLSAIARRNFRDCEQQRHDDASQTHHDEAPQRRAARIECLGERKPGNPDWYGADHDADSEYK